MLLVKSVAWAPVIQVLILAFGTLSSFVIAYSRGDVSIYLPFISETGAYSPEMGIFSFSLFLGSAYGTFLIVIRFIFIRKLKEDKLFTRMNYASLISGILSMLGLAGVAAFPMTTVFWAHLLAAGSYFFGSALYFVCSTILTWQVEGRSKKFIFRCILTAIILILLFLLAICFPISLTRWHQNNDIIPALKQPENEGFGMILFCAFLEWFIVLIIVAYTLTFLFELRGQSLKVTVVPISDGGGSEAQDCNREENIPTQSSDVIP